MDTNWQEAARWAANYRRQWIKQTFSVHHAQTKYKYIWFTQFIFFVLEDLSLILTSWVKETSVTIFYTRIVVDRAHLTGVNTGLKLFDWFRFFCKGLWFCTICASRMKIRIPSPYSHVFWTHLSHWLTKLWS